MVYISWLIKGIIMVVLVSSAYQDIKRKEILIVPIIAASFLIFGINLISQQQSWSYGIFGAGIGLGLMFVNKITRGQVGMGDAFIFCMTGTGLGFFDNLSLLVCSLMVASIFIIFLLFTGKIKRKMTIPFVPFISIGFVILLVLSNFL